MISPVLLRPSVVIWFLAAASAALLGIVVLVLGDREDSLDLAYAGG